MKNIKHFQTILGGFLIVLITMLTSITCAAENSSAPVITGINNGGTYCESVVVTVKDNDLDRVTVNGSSVKLQNDQFKVNSSTTEQTIVATDKAGNSTQCTITVNASHEYVLGTIIDPTTNEAGSAICSCGICTKTRKVTLVPTNNNTVSGLKGNRSYVAGETLSFEAVGYNDTLTNPRAGMTRSIPTQWSYNGETINWSSSPFRGTKAMNQTGTATLMVNFSYQVYSGYSWINTGYVYGYSTSITVTKAAPSYTVPERITVEYGTALKNIKLPSGFAWQEADDTKLVHLGYVYAYATYTNPADRNSVKVSNIEIPLNVVCSNHQWIDKENINKSSCSSDGQKLQVCKICGTTRTIVEKAKGHNYSTVVIPATCKEGGYTLHTCLNCGDSYTTDETPLAEHTYETTEVAASCKKGAYLLQKCTVCGNEIETEKSNPLGHAWANPEEVRENELILTKYTCSRCGEIQYNEGHEPQSSNITETTNAKETTEKESVSYINNETHTHSTSLIIVISILSALLIIAIIALIFIKKSGRLDNKQ